MENESNILTRFVIVEKYISIKFYKYHTPYFNNFGVRVSIFDSCLPRMFVHPGFYITEFDTREIDSEILSSIISEEIQTLYYDLVASLSFDCLISERKTLSLFKEKNGKYRDTS
jgi:hypothetical protein